MIKTCLGVDPASNTGLVALRSTEERSHELLWSRMNAAKDGKGKPVKGFDRLHMLAAGLEKAIDDCQPDLAVIEGYAYGNRFSIVTAVEIGTVYRMIFLRRKIPLFTMAPNALKKFITGNGSAKKNTIMMEVFKRYNFQAPTDDIADAYGLSIAGLVVSGAIMCPAFQLDAVSSLQQITCTDS